MFTFIPNNLKRSRLQHRTEAIKSAPFWHAQKLHSCHRRGLLHAAKPPGRPDATARSASQAVTTCAPAASITALGALECRRDQAGFDHRIEFWRAASRA